MDIPIRRRQIWLASLDDVTVGKEQRGARPVLIMSVDEFNDSRADLVVVIPLTKSDAPISSHIPIEPPEGAVKQKCFIQCEQIKSISKIRLKEPWGSISTGTMTKVEEVIGFLLHLP